MNRMTTPLVRWSVSVACTAFLGPVAYADVAGHVQFVNGNVQLSSASGPARSLQKGDAVREGDTLTSAAAASAQIRMQDGGMVAVRSETQLKFDQFVFNGKQDGTERSFFSLLKGGFRAVTGLVGQLNKTNYRIVTPVATIGIRGTDHETFLIVPGSALAQLAPAGAYSKVNVGETTLTTNQGSINVTPNQMGFAAGLNQPPLVQPINTKVFTVAQTPAAPAPGAKKENAVAGNTSPAASPTEGSAPAGEAPSPGTQTASAPATGNNTENRPPAEETPSGTSPNTAPRPGATTPNAAPGAPLAEPAAPPILRTTAVVDSVAPNANLIPLSNTPPPPPPSTAQTILTAPPTTNTTAPTTATVTGGTTVNLTTAAATTSSGQVLAVSDGLVAAQAQAAANAALAASNAVGTARTALMASKSNLSALVLDISAASTAVAQSQTKTDDAQNLVNGLGTSAPADTTQANTTAANASALKTTAASQLSTASAKNSANGSFATSDATTALATATEYKGYLDTHAANVQSAKDSVVNAVNDWTSAKSQAVANLSTASPKNSAAAAGLETAQAKKTTFDITKDSALASYSTLLAEVDSALSTAQAASEQASAAAAQALSLQQSGDLVGAQAQLTLAQQARDTAQAKLTLVQVKRDALATALSQAQTLASDGNTAAGLAASSASAASTAADSAFAAATLAGTKATDASAAMELLGSEYATVEYKAGVVAENAPLAAYSHPRATTGILAMAVLPVGSASNFNAGQASSSSPVANTTVVLDGNGNLVEARDLAYGVRAFQNGSAIGSPIASANVKYTGGTAADTFKLADNSIYGGRWMGATVTVSDNSNSTNTSSATPAASLWAVILPPALNYVSSLTGTTSYSQVAATQPVDAAGNLGTLNSATLSANFTAGTLDASANLTMGTGTMAGTFQLTSTGMAIGPLGGFESSTASSATTACTTGGCSAGGSGYSSRLGGGLAGNGAASAGLLYRLWSTPVSPGDPVSNAVDGLVAFQAGTAPTVDNIAGQAQTAATAAQAAATAAQSATTALQTASTQTAALAPANTASAVSAVNAATSAIAAANTTNTTVSTLVPANLTTANANASTANSIATSIASQLAAAQTLYTAHGSYRDSSAGPALSSAQAANTALQAAATAVQDAATAVSSNNDLLTLKQTLSQSELESANPAFTNATSSLGTANTSNTALTTAQSAAASTNATHLANAQAATTAAQTAASAAQAAATLAASLQASGDLTGAQAQRTLAQGQLAIAQSKQALAATERAAVEATLSTIQANLADAQTAITNAIDQAGQAQSHANTASTYLGIAQTAYTDAQTALAATSTGLSGISGNAATVASQSAIAGYHNPAVSRNVNAVAVLPVGSASSYNAGQASSSTPVANTTVVLDGNGNLVEARNLAYGVRAFQNGSAVGSPIASADVKYTGGTAADTFKLADNSIYGGRWMGATVTVSDNNSVAISSATPAASLWAVILPPALNYVSSLTGTTSYSQVAATQPVDAAGNLGTLNSATLSANFTAGTLDASANLTMGSGTMAGTFQLTSTGMAIGPLGGFESSTASSTSTACTTGVCSAGGTGYSSTLGGGLAGDGAASAGLLYRLWSTPMYPNDPVSNAVDGLVAFQAGTAPTVSSGVASYSAIGTAVAMTGSFSMGNNFIAKSGDLTLSGDAPITLVQRYAMGLGLQTTTLINPTSSIPVTALSGGIKYGIWETVSNVITSNQFTLQPSPENHSVSPLPVYMVGAQGYVDSAVMFGTNTGPLVGSFSYTPVLHVSKDSASWSNSTATSASLSANFTTQTVDMALAGTTSGTNWSLSSTAMPLSFNSTSNGAGATFNASSAVVKVDTAPLSGSTPVCVTCSADLNGAFVGQNYAGAIVQYTLQTGSSSGLNLNVGGLVAYDRIGVGGNPVVSDGVAAPTGGKVLATSWELSQLATAPVFDAGVLQSWGESSFNTSITIGAGSSAQTPVGSAGSGQIDWGIWAAGSTMALSGSYPPGTNELLWITAPEPTPVYLSQVLTNTAAGYTLLGGDITTLSNTSHGSFDGASTSLTVNFSTQTVGLSLKASVNGHNWLASTSNAPLQFVSNNAHSGFYADSYRSVGTPGYLSVTVDGQGANGDISGQLVGTDFNNAILKFNLGGMVAGPSYERVQGVAAFAASSANDASTPYRMLLTSLSDPTASQPEAKVNGTYSAASRTVLVGSGDARKFDHGESTLDFTSGTHTETGSAVIDGLAVNWGRWMPGSTADVTKRATGAVQSLTLAGGAHVITGPLMTAPVALPTNGTYSYTMAGSTAPTDHLGNVGTLNSASLSANFTAQTVDVGVNVTVAGTTLGASATGVPIQQRSFFMADSRVGGASNLAVGCSGAACGTTNQGTLVGGFAGANGKAAGMAYGFTKVGANAGTVNGVVVFQRP